MSNVDGIIGGGIKLKLTNSAGNLQQVLGLMTGTPPAASAGTTGSTDQSSNRVEEFITTLINPGEVSGTIKYVPGNPDDVLFREHLYSLEKRPMELEQPGQPGQLPEVVTASIAVTAFTPNDGAVGDIRTSSFTLKVSGLSTQATAEE